MPESLPLAYATPHQTPHGRTPLRWAKLGLVVCFSSGWLVPLSYAILSLLTWCKHEQNGTHQFSSFPYLSFASDMFAIALPWLALVVLAWSIAAARRVFPAAKARPETFLPQAHIER